jgi:pimeloyl-ACP methyl ester carboxylesterase
LAQVEAIERGCGGPVERLTLAGCGHAPHAERPDEVLDTMTRFVAALSPLQGSTHDSPEHDGHASH